MSLDLLHITQVAIAGVISLVSSGASLAVQASNLCSECPGAESTLIAAAWANIGYMTHAAILHYVNFGGIGLWAPLLYVVAAAGALVSVAINSPPRNYVWFILGPAIYGFLVGTTQKVKGVDWVVAGKPQNMREVWRDAETGLKNSPLLQIPDYQGMKINKYEEPSKSYPVAMPMLFLDELLSATTNILVGYTGLYNQLGEGRNDSNLAQAQNSNWGAAQNGGGGGKRGEGPWYLLSSLKSPMVENIVGSGIRNPDLRDAFITFLSSECGDAFKKGIDSGAYNAATLSRGSVLPMTVFKGQGGPNKFDGTSLKVTDVTDFKQYLISSYMPSPHSLRRILSEDTDTAGSFSKFSSAFQGGLKSIASKETVGDSVACSSYLWILIQAMRHEMGHAYWQLVRNAPDGFSEESLLFTLFYGWDIRSTPSSKYADDDQMRWFTQNLIFVYLLKNELQFAPSITSVDQKFAPSDQTRQYTQTYVASMAAKSKHGELYNWALMMPHIQGILLYVIIVAYPLAAMAMVIPGYWKAFFTWVTFFAWIKMWDVGFAVVQVLERSVWAMMGNHSNMARVANMLIQMAEESNEVGVKCSDSAGSGSESLGKQCAVPDVTNGGWMDNGGEQKEDEAFFFLDKALILSASVDLDVSNGYYIYIMSALYFAVPAVTGQLILGAKSGLGNLATSALGDHSREAGGAAKSGVQGEASSRINTAMNLEGNGAYAKALRKGGLAAGAMKLENDNLDRTAENSWLEGRQGAINAGASARDLKARSYNSSADVWAKTTGAASNQLDRAVKKSASGGGAGGGGGPTGAANAVSWASDVGGVLRTKAQNALNQQGYEADMYARGQGLATNWTKSGNELLNNGANMQGRRVSDGAQYDAEMARWQAKNAFANRNAGMSSVYGVNTGMAAGDKPVNSTGMALSGDLNVYGAGGKLKTDARGISQYSGSFMNNVGEGWNWGGSQGYGNQFVQNEWGGATGVTLGVPLVTGVEAQRNNWKTYGPK
jgi:hypothetical protein